MYTFVGPTIWKTIYEELGTEFSLPKDCEKKVTILRPILFFHADEKTSLSKIMNYFTPKAIGKLIHDKFIEIND